MASQKPPGFFDNESREARSAARDLDFECDPAVAAALEAFLDQQKAFIDTALRDSDAGEFSRWNDRFTAATPM